MTWDVVRTSPSPSPSDDNLLYGTARRLGMPVVGHAKPSKNPHAAFANLQVSPHINALSTVAQLNFMILSSHVPHRDCESR